MRSLGGTPGLKGKSLSEKRTLEAARRHREEESKEEEEDQLKFAEFSRRVIRPREPFPLLFFFPSGNLPERLLFVVLLSLRGEISL